MMEKDIKRFWSKVRITPGCWEWTAGTRRSPRMDKGYGRFWLNGKLRSAHRVSFELAYGPLAPGEVVRHLVCDHVLCVNPAHLAKGSQLDNIEDTWRSGRVRWGVGGKWESGLDRPAPSVPS